VKWTIALPRVVAEDDRVQVEVEADTIEDAIKAAAPRLHKDSGPRVGTTYLVSARVQVVKQPSLPLKSV
jgi:hypothetical protein